MDYWHTSLVRLYYWYSSLGLWVLWYGSHTSESECHTALYFYHMLSLIHDCLMHHMLSLYGSIVGDEHENLHGLCRCCQLQTKWKCFIQLTLMKHYDSCNVNFEKQRNIMLHLSYNNQMIQNILLQRKNISVLFCQNQL